MNKAQKELLQAQLDAEKEQLKTLKGIYKKAEQDIDDKIAQLMGRSDADMQNVIYQLEYQKALKKQVSGILDTLHGNEFTSVSEYLTKCYENGFVGTMYDIHKQGIPIIEPIDQSLIAKAITVDTKLSQGLYERLGEDVSQLKKRIANNISRGIATGSTFAEIARNVKGVSNVSYNNAMRIVKTEGGRINAQASHHAQQRAKKAGADVVKQWNSTLDGKTRDTHRELDGKLAEVDEPFKLHGLEAMFPHDFGSPEEDINCRCTILQRAKWALDEDELKELEARAEYFGLDKADDLKTFKDKYLIITQEKIKNYKKTIANLAESSKMVSNIVRDAIKEGKVLTKINPEKQKRHLKNSKYYVKGRSFLEGTIEDAQKFVNELVEKGSPIIDRKGKWTNKVRVESAKIKGTHIDPETGKETKTNKATIILSKTGSHIVPRKDG